MQLIDYFSEESTHLIRFVEWWANNNKQNPDQFPMEMEPGDWDEQYKDYRCKKR